MSCNYCWPGNCCGGPNCLSKKPSAAPDIDIVLNLHSWARVLDIPSGRFVNEDLEAAADHIAALRAERDEALAVQPCGHHHSLLVRSVESEYTFCELCEARHMQRDAETADAAHRVERDKARAASEIYRIRAERAEGSLARIKAAEYAWNEPARAALNEQERT